ncbi:MAG TPA: DUF5658 family protein [Armatimonadota bacterium]|nr:DUF5658 family protein [Armatimonadota bacterium]
MPDQGDTPKYFWSDDLAGPAFRALAAAFALVSAADLLATWTLLEMGVIREGNALANWMLREYGGPGLIAFKLLLVAIILGIAAYVHARRPGAGRTILWVGLLVTGAVLLRHIAILLAII